MIGWGCACSGCVWQVRGMGWCRAAQGGAGWHRLAQLQRCRAVAALHLAGTADGDGVGRAAPEACCCSCGAGDCRGGGAGKELVLGSTGGCGEAAGARCLELAASAISMFSGQAGREI